MKISRIYGVLFVLGTSLIAGGLSYAQNASSKMGDRVEICVPTYKEELLTTEIILANERGYFKDAGLDAEVTLVKGHDVSRGGDKELFQAAVSDNGHCRFASSSVEDLIVSGVDLSKLSPMYVYLYGKNYDTHLVVAKSSGIQTVADLKGKRIRVGQIPTQIALGKILGEAGLTLKDVEIVPGDQMTPSAILPAMEKGTLQAAISYYPTMAMMLSSGKVRVLKENVFRTYVLPNVPHAFVAVNAAYAKTNPEAVKKFRQAIERADQEVQKNPAELVAVIGRHAAFLGVQGWDSSPVLAQRSAELIRGLHLTGISGQAYGGLTVLEALDQFGALLMDRKYVAQRPDFSVWKHLGTFAGQKTAAR